jgi:hypothetical protein
MTLVKTVVMIIRFCVLSISSKLLSLSRLLRDTSVGTSPPRRWQVVVVVGACDVLYDM